MTLLNILLLLAFVVVMFVMMKKGGGCCGGGHSHKQHTAHGDDQKVSHGQQNKLESGSSKINTDPVCGMTVDLEGGLSSQHHGKQYTFCSEHCQKSFAADPDKYVRS